MKKATFTFWDEHSKTDGHTAHVFIDKNGCLCFGSIYRKTGDLLTLDQQIELLRLVNIFKGRLVFHD